MTDKPRRGIYSIRRAVPEDHPTLSRFMASLQNLEHALHPDRPPGAAVAEQHMTYLLRECEAHDGRALLAETSEGLATGFVLFMVEDLGGHYIEPQHRKVGWVSDIWIEPEHRGRGVLDMMLSAAEEHFRALGITRLMLAYLCRNEAAGKAYTRRGFTAYERILERSIS